MDIERKYFEEGVRRVRLVGDFVCHRVKLALFMAMAEVGLDQKGHMEFGWLGPESLVSLKVGLSRAPMFAPTKLMELVAARPQFEGLTCTPVWTEPEKKGLCLAGGVKDRRYGVGVSGFKDDKLDQLFALLFLRLLTKHHPELRRLEYWTTDSDEYQALVQDHRELFPGRLAECHFDRTRIWSHQLTSQRGFKDQIAIGQVLAPEWTRPTIPGSENRLALALHFTSGWPANDLDNTFAILEPSKANFDNFAGVYWVHGHDGSFGVRFDYASRIESELSREEMGM